MHEKKWIPWHRLGPFDHGKTRRKSASQPIKNLTCNVCPIHFNIDCSYRRIFDLSQIKRRDKLCYHNHFFVFFQFGLVHTRMCVGHGQSVLPLSIPTTTFFYCLSPLLCVVANTLRLFNGNSNDFWWTLLRTCHSNWCVCTFSIWCHRWNRNGFFLWFLKAWRGSDFEFSSSGPNMCA